MLEQSKITLMNASAEDRRAAEIIALRYMASELEENLMSASEAMSTARAHREAGDEAWQRAVFGILLGLREAEAQGYHVRK